MVSKFLYMEYTMFTDIKMAAEMKKGRANRNTASWLVLRKVNCSSVMAT